jgi:hypothetical protein
MANRRERRREDLAKAKAETPRIYNVTMEQMVSMLNEDKQKAYREGQKDGMSRAVDACLQAFSLVLVENHGMSVEEVTTIFQETDKEVWIKLNEKDFGLDDLDEYAKATLGEEGKSA